MREVQAKEIAKLVGAGVSSNLLSFDIALQLRGKTAGLNRPARLVAMLAQLSHESAGFKYDREVWGPTPAQLRYDTRTDLGNTAAVDGDGKFYAGRGPLQVTGRTNYADFLQWCRTKISKDVPDFVVEPDLLNTDPWEGLSVFWFWETRELNLYVDARNLAGLSKRINGGTNGLSDRLKRFSEIGIRFLGYSSIKAFQSAQGLATDGIAGPVTRKRIFDLLEAHADVVFPGSVSSTSPTAAKTAGFLTWLVRLLFPSYKRTS